MTDDPRHEYDSGADHGPEPERDEALAGLFAHDPVEPSDDAFWADLASAMRDEAADAAVETAEVPAVDRGSAEADGPVEPTTQVRAVEVGGPRHADNVVPMRRRARRFAPLAAAAALLLLAVVTVRPWNGNDSDLPDIVASGASAGDPIDDGPGDGSDNNDDAADAGDVSEPGQAGEDADDVNDDPVEALAESSVPLAEPTFDPFAYDGTRSLEPGERIADFRQVCIGDGASPVLARSAPSDRADVSAQLPASCGHVLLEDLGTGYARVLTIGDEGPTARFLPSETLSESGFVEEIVTIEVTSVTAALADESAETATGLVDEPDAPRCTAPGVTARFALSVLNPAARSWNPLGLALDGGRVHVPWQLQAAAPVRVDVTDTVDDVECHWRGFGWVDGRGAGYVTGDGIVEDPTLPVALTEVDRRTTEEVELDRLLCVDNVEAPDVLNVRSRPTVEGELVHGLAPTDCAYRAGVAEDGWELLRIEVDGEWLVGWASGRFLVEGDAIDSAYQRHEATDGVPGCVDGVAGLTPLNVRAAPSIQGTIMERLEDGHCNLLLGESEGDWTMVQVLRSFDSSDGPGVEALGGWVASAYITPLDEMENPALVEAFVLLDAGAAALDPETVLRSVRCETQGVLPTDAPALPSVVVDPDGEPAEPGAGVDTVDAETADTEPAEEPTAEPVDATAECVVSYWEWAAPGRCNRREVDAWFEDERRSLSLVWLDDEWRLTARSTNLAADC